MSRGETNHEKTMGTPGTPPDVREDLFGGRGADTFVISREQRDSVIRDFKHSGDRIIVENLRGVQAGWDGRDFSWSRNGETIVTIENMMDLIDNRSLRLAQGGFTIA